MAWRQPTDLPAAGSRRGRALAGRSCPSLCCGYQGRGGWKEHTPVAAVGPEAMSKPWRGWVEKKGVHPPLVTVSFLQALMEAGPGVA